VSVKIFNHGENSLSTHPDVEVVVGALAHGVARAVQRAALCFKVAGGLVFNEGIRFNAFNFNCSMTAENFFESSFGGLYLWQKE
jgi:hypothetical protein